MKRNIILIATTAIAIALSSGLANLPGDHLARVSANAEAPEMGGPANFVEPQIQIPCLATCSPTVSKPTVHYLRHNGSMHEVELVFTYSNPCAGDPNLNLFYLQLDFPKGIHRLQANVRACEVSDIHRRAIAGTCKTLVRVPGSASDGRPTAYVVNVEASITIVLTGNNINRNNNTPF